MDLFFFVSSLLFMIEAPSVIMMVASIVKLFPDNNVSNDNSLSTSFTQMSIFALNVTPYITSSIIIQLLTIAIPALEEMQKDGEDGRKKITAITRYVTIFLAVIESLGLVIGFDRGHYMTVTGPLGYLLVIITLTTGSAFVMWLGERVTEKGVGNPLSVLYLYHSNFAWIVQVP